MGTPTADELVRLLKLEPHPEGGFYREHYRSAGAANGRAHSTAIYFLLPEGRKSKLHRIKSDELWHFYLGGPVAIAELRADGLVVETALGPRVEDGQALSHCVPAGAWFGARPLPGSGYSLVGCTVAPGFDFADLEFADRAALLASHPAAASLIKALTD